MELKVYAIWDSAVGAYNTPFFMRADGEAVRAFVATAQDKSTRIYTGAADFTLMRLASWSDESGVFEVDQERLMGGLEARDGVTKVKEVI